MIGSWLIGNIHRDIRPDLLIFNGGSYIYGAQASGRHFTDSSFLFHGSLYSQLRLIGQVHKHNSR